MRIKALPDGRPAIEWIELWPHFSPFVYQSTRADDRTLKETSQLKTPFFY